MVATIGLVSPALAMPTALPIEEPIATQVSRPRSGSRQRQRVAADVAGDAGAGGAHRHEARRVRAAGAQHRRPDHQFRRPAIVPAAAPAGCRPWRSRRAPLRARTRRRAGRTPCPSTLMPSAAISFSITGSSSSTTKTRSTVAQKSRSSLSGQRPGGAELQHAGVRQHFADVRIAGAGGDDAERGVAHLRCG